MWLIFFPRAVFFFWEKIKTRSIVFIFHIMMIQKDTRLKRYLKSTSWQQQSSCLQCSGKCLHDKKYFKFWKGRIFVWAEPIWVASLKHPSEIAACLVPWCSQFSGHQFLLAEIGLQGPVIHSTVWLLQLWKNVSCFKRLQMLSVCQGELAERGTCLVCLLWCLD